MGNYKIDRDSSASSGGVGIIGVVQIVLIILKVCKVINWNWLIVFSPLIGSAIIYLIILAIMLIVFAIK